MRNRRVWISALISILIFSISPFAAGDPGDSVFIVVDVSQSMLPYREQVTRYVTDEIMKESVGWGDTVFILRFDSQPAVQAAVTVKDKSDIESLLRELLLLDYLGRYTDINRALDFLTGYIGDIESSEKLIIFFLSDFIQDPPPGIRYEKSAAELMDSHFASMGKKELDGWSVYLLTRPTLLPSSDKETKIAEDSEEEKAAVEEPRSPAVEEKGQEEATAAPKTAETDASQNGQEPELETEEVEMPDNRAAEKEEDGKSADQEAEKETTEPESPIDQTRFREEDTDASRPEDAETDASRPQPSEDRKEDTGSPKEDTESPAENKADRQTKSDATVKQKSAPETQAASGQKDTADLPAKEDDAEAETREASGNGIRINWNFLPILLYVLAGLFALAMLIWLAVKLRQKLKTEPVYTLSKQQPDQARYGNRPIEMKVFFQNSHIGSRNIHWIKKNSAKSIGGGVSAYLIFLVPVPYRIAEIVYDGSQYSFIPLKKVYFPGVRDNIAGCLNEWIAGVADNGQEFSLIFREYVSPLEELNKLMRSVNSPRNH